MFQNDIPFFAEEQSETQSPQGQNVWATSQILNDPLHNPEFAKICGGELFPLELYFMATCSIMRRLAGTESLPLSVRKLTDSCGFIFPELDYKGKLHIEFPDFSFNVSVEAFGIIFTLYAFWSTKCIFEASNVSFDKELLEHIKTHKEFTIIIGTLRLMAATFRKNSARFSASNHEISQETGGTPLPLEKKEQEKSSGEKPGRQASQEFEIE